MVSGIRARASPVVGMVMQAATGAEVIPAVKVSAVRLGRVENVPVMEAQYDGSWVEGTFSGYEWLDPTDGCKLVWSRKWHAESCAARGHRNRFYQYYYTQIQNGDGQPPTVVETRYERRALRRAIPRAQATLAASASAPAPAPAAPTPEPPPPVATAKPKRVRKPKPQAASAPEPQDLADAKADAQIERMLDQEPVF